MRFKLCEHGQLETLWDLLEAFYAENGIVDPNRPKAFPFVEKTVDGGRCWLLYPDDGDEPIGTFGYEIVAPWWSDELRLQDVWIYIKPEYRSLSSFRSVLDLADRLAARANLPLYIQLYVAGADRKKVLFKRYLDELAEVYEVKYVGGRFRGRAAGNQEQ